LGRDVLELLQLGRQGFTPQLQAYLSSSPDLLWMSQVQAKQYAAATSSLTTAASAATAEDAQRLWCLTKLSVNAAGKQAPNGKQMLYTASARLRQLQLQGQLVPGRMGGQRPMLAEELAEAAIRAAGQGVGADGSDQGLQGIRGAEAAVAAAEVLALEAGSNETQSYRCDTLLGMGRNVCLEFRIRMKYVCHIRMRSVCVCIRTRAKRVLFTGAVSRHTYETRSLYICLKHT
jgi:hypothetical protein